MLRLLCSTAAMVMALSPLSAKEPSATPADSLKLPEGFKAELIYNVPKDEQGSWVCMCVDDDGRLIVSDQYGKLYRVTPPSNDTKFKLEPIPAEIGMAQGLLWAFDSLYVVVNAGGNKAGLFRVTDSDKDGMVDNVTKLSDFVGAGGEHGCHAIIKHPDGKRLSLCCGNQTQLKQCDITRPEPIWGEDHLLPRMPDGNGFMKGTLAPGGCIYNIDPDGKTWELVSMGFRNEYDIAYNNVGELFTYDADMEWDVNTPWYRPTRVCHVVSGADWGWRNGSGKYPEHYIDTLPPVVNIGPGSPTGICFGYGAKFPDKYRNALFICDWSYGILYAIHMQPDGATYKGEIEKFTSGTPLPLTDVVINPNDGAMYFTIGGRKTQSGLYRVTYEEPASLVEDVNTSTPDSAIRHELEHLHVGDSTPGVDFAWKHLNHSDRFVRYAARVALEHAPVTVWQDRVFAETNVRAQLLGMLALVRKSMPDPQHEPKSDGKANPQLRQTIVDALSKHEFAKLDADLKLALLRVYMVYFNRFGPPEAAEKATVLKQLDAALPTGNRVVDSDLLQVLVYLESPTVAPKAMKMLAESPTQEEQIDIGKSLRVLQSGWTPELRKAYLTWFQRASTFKGGNSMKGFMALIKKDAVAALPPQQRIKLRPIINAKPKETAVAMTPPRPFVKAWTVEELTPIVEEGLKEGGRDYDHGRKLFGATNCFSCHRYDNEGGAAGPDLTGIAGRFSPHDLLESIINPNKEISDQYQAVEIDTLDGQKVVGRIVNLSGDTIRVNVNMLDPNGQITVNRNNIDEMHPSKNSMMPAGLLDTMTQDEILDLMAYVLSRGDRNAAMFK